MRELYWTFGILFVLFVVYGLVDAAVRSAS